MPTQPLGPGRTLREIAPGVLVAHAETWATTTTVVVGCDGSALLVDPALTPADIDATARALAARGLRTVAGFATHAHWDHVLWSAPLGELPRWCTPNARAVAVRTHAALVREAEATAPGHDLALLGALTPLPALAGEPVRDAVEVPWEGPRVLVVEHDAHSPGHAALVVPHARTLVAGDMLSDVEVPLLDLDGPDPWGDYVTGLGRVERAVGTHELETVVPGHGSPAVGGSAVRARFAADRRYLADLARAAEPGASGPSRRATDDPRLADPWVRAEHEQQLAVLRDAAAAR